MQSHSETHGKQPPNVVVILADDMGWGDLGCYGAEKIPTPRMDRLATEGIRLLDCHSSSAVCTPSRYSLLTGRYAWRSPLKNGVLLGHSPPIIEPGRCTIASLLSERGYTTGAFGKWHLGLGWRRTDGSVRSAFSPGAVLRDSPDDGGDVDYTSAFSGGPIELGFERFFGMAASLDMPPFSFLDQDRTFGVPDRDKEHYLPKQKRGVQGPEWQDEMIDVRFVDEACQWIREQASNQPFFCYLATSAPHWPPAPPDFAIGQSQAGRRGDLVWLVDWAVGRLLDTLDDLAIADNTLVIVTSDNGATPGDMNGRTYGHSSNGHWRGQKADIWEAGHRIPFVARWPANIPANAVSDELVCLTDVSPTIAGLVGAPMPVGAAEDGHDISSVLTCADEQLADRLVINHSYHGWFAARLGQWKAIFGTGSGGFSKPQGQPSSSEHPHGQLYDLHEDPEEHIDLWDDRPDVVSDLHERLSEVGADSSGGLPAPTALTLSSALNQTSTNEME